MLNQNSHVLSRTCGLQVLTGSLSCLGLEQNLWNSSELPADLATNQGSANIRLIEFFLSPNLIESLT